MAKANVESIEALERFSSAIESLRDSSRKNSDDIRDQFQRISTWLGKELPEYWADQLRVSQKRWTEARGDLLRCQAKSRAEDETSCMLERKALERATTRRQMCEQRTKLVPQLAMQWEQYLQESTLSVRQLEDLSDSLLPLAQVRLQQLIETLKLYASQGGHEG
jgi:F0F1-type ATP synthase membrane subunit b/b'